MALRCFKCLPLQEQVDAAVKELLALKAEFKKETGQDYKPGMAPTPAAKAPAPQAPAERPAQQGEILRKLKSEKAPKVSLKNNYLWLFGRLHFDYNYVICTVSCIKDRPL